MKQNDTKIPKETKNKLELEINRMIEEMEEMEEIENSEQNLEDKCKEKITHADYLEDEFESVFWKKNIKIDKGNWK